MTRRIGISIVAGRRRTAVAVAAAVAMALAPWDAAADGPAARSEIQQENLAAVDTIRAALKTPPPSVRFSAPAPSAAAFALLADADVTATPAQAVALRSLDARPARQRDALSAVFSAFAEYQSIVKTAQAKDRLDGSDVFQAKVDLAQAAMALRPTLAPAAQPLDATCPAPTEIPLVLAFSLGQCDDVYTVDAALSIDGGGNDTYKNHAGGGRPLTPAAALINFGGDDYYIGSDFGWAANAVNGGGYTGSGFLLDVDGNDYYFAGGSATNGGGVLGSGFLADTAGNDTYIVSSPLAWDVGASNGGSIVGRGFLADLAGDDRYEAESGGVNGGACGALLAWAMTSPASGFLFDGAGNDAYVAGYYGTNGGATILGDGLLLDAGGNDTYKARRDVNGRAYATNGGGALGAGALNDLGGRDFYDDEVSQAWDQTVPLKGTAGTQVDTPAG